MKLRLGFVANSSSSAFVLIVPVDVHEKVLEGLHPYVRAVAEAWGVVQDVVGSQCYVAGELEVRDQDDYTWDYIDIEYDGKPMTQKFRSGETYEVEARDAWDIYQVALPKGSYFKWQITA